MVDLDQWKLWWGEPAGRAGAAVAAPQGLTLFKILCISFVDTKNLKGRCATHLSLCIRRQTNDMI